ncbi:MAG: hypothetical protein EZS28_009612 [Streblomastix strix]|uniref:Uncharacterized protein n=1 Tax=Streblomastix strix TaxID=222440 RepID=A0A5J4WIY3_9EUKA|nr:MAG: hypothetical protein EZS28_009612 [Streblomastix strix]
MVGAKAVARALNHDKRKADGDTDQKRYISNSIICISHEIYFYEDEHKVYNQANVIKSVDEELEDVEDETNEQQNDIPIVDILIVQEEIGGKLPTGLPACGLAQHAFAIANKEALNRDQTGKAQLVACLT